MRAKVFKVEVFDIWITEDVLVDEPTENTSSVYSSISSWLYKNKTPEKKSVKKLWVNEKDEPRVVQFKVNFSFDDIGNPEVDKLIRNKLKSQFNLNVVDYKLKHFCVEV